MNNFLIPYSPARLDFKWAYFCFGAAPLQPGCNTKKQSICTSVVTFSLLTHIFIGMLSPMVWHFC